MRVLDRADNTTLSPGELLQRLMEATRRLHQLEAELEHLQRLATLGALAGGVAHEINNILTPVLSYSQLALSHPHDPELRRMALEKTVDSVNRTSQIVGAILGFSRPEDLVLEADVLLSAKGALSCLARPPEREGVLVRLDIPAGIGARIRRIALEQVFLNLILNALEAMRPGRGSLSITAHCSTWNTPTTPAITIKVGDSGPGIPPDLQEKVFEPFFTTRNDPNSEHRGVGLGLAMCKRLVEEAGGTIELWSELGRGAVFTITLPMASQDRKAA